MAPWPRPPPTPKIDSLAFGPDLIGNVVQEYVHATGGGIDGDGNNDDQSHCMLPLLPREREMRD